jgi:bifunctional non-homologous end joining protein LigD
MNGHDRSDRYPWIVDTARRLRQRQLVIDGEAVVLGVDGVSDFAALYSRNHDAEAQFYAFDMLASDSDDMRPSVAALDPESELGAAPCSA